MACDQIAGHPARSSLGAVIAGKPVHKWLVCTGSVRKLISCFFSYWQSHAAHDALSLVTSSMTITMGKLEQTSWRNRSPSVLFANRQFQQMRSVPVKLVSKFFNSFDIHWFYLEQKTFRARFFKTKKQQWCTMNRATASQTDFHQGHVETYSTGVNISYKKEESLPFWQSSLSQEQFWNHLQKTEKTHPSLLTLVLVQSKETSDP